MRKNEMKFWLLEVIGLGAVTSVSQVVGIAGYQ